MTNFTTKLGGFRSRCTESFKHNKLSLISVDQITWSIPGLQKGFAIALGELRDVFISWSQPCNRKNDVCDHPILITQLMKGSFRRLRSTNLNTSKASGSRLSELVIGQAFDALPSYGRALTLLSLSLSHRLHSQLSSACNGPQLLGHPFNIAVFSYTC